jgi:uncharacterized repeat protein (TIGR03803 family)
MVDDKFQRRTGRVPSPQRTGALIGGAIAMIIAGVTHADPTYNRLFSLNNRQNYTSGTGVIVDTAGNLYGSEEGGPDGVGSIFELSPPIHGGSAWTQTILHNFKTSGGGEDPSSGLLMDGTGHLYGATYAGGPDNKGIVFELTPPAAGKTQWTERPIYSFKGADVTTPVSNLMVDPAGNIYGSVLGDEIHSYGSVIELIRPTNGEVVWKEKVLHAFGVSDGAYPVGRMVLDSAGNLYGATELGGKNGHGLVFELSPPAAGQTAWTETVVYDLGGKGNPGRLPRAGLIIDEAGNLYGTTVMGGAANQGEVFELSPPAVGQTAWVKTVLVSFDGPNGSHHSISDRGPGLPQPDLIADSVGNIYGATPKGGAYGLGVLFKLSPPQAGQTAWTEVVLHSFGEFGARHGAGNSLAVDSAGAVYGTTVRGGRYGIGVVFKVTP